MTLKELIKQAKDRADTALDLAYLRKQFRTKDHLIAAVRALELASERLEKDLELEMKIPTKHVEGCPFRDGETHRPLSDCTCPHFSPGSEALK